MSLEHQTRLIEDILRRLDHLEALSTITYLSGTYTPTYTGSVTPGVTTYTTQVGWWWRIGKLVFFNGRLVWTAATGTGTASFLMPFTPASGTDQRGALSVFTDAVTFANGSIQARIAPGDSHFFLSSPLTNGTRTDVVVEAAGVCDFAGWFSVT